MSFFPPATPRRSLHRPRQPIPSIHNLTPCTRPFAALSAYISLTNSFSRSHSSGKQPVLCSPAWCLSVLRRKADALLACSHYILRGPSTQRSSCPRCSPSVPARDRDGCPSSQYLPLVQRMGRVRAVCLCGGCKNLFPRSSQNQPLFFIRDCRWWTFQSNQITQSLRAHGRTVMLECFSCHSPTGRDR